MTPIDVSDLVSVEPPKMSFVDLVDEASAGLFARPGRTLLTVLGTVIGLAALVATLGLSSTASNRIVGRFDELAATEIVVSSREFPRRCLQPNSLGCVGSPQPAQRSCSSRNPEPNRCRKRFDLHSPGQ